MAHTRFESELNLGSIISGILHGGITGVAIQEKDAAGVYQPTLIIRTDRDWAINVKWALVGTMLDSPFFTIPGKWVVKAYLEGWEQNAEEKDLDSDSGGVHVAPPMTHVPGVPGVSDPEWRYQDTFTILRANTPRPGPYRLAITITYEDAAGNPGPMAGFLEVGDMVQLYDPSQPDFNRTRTIETADLQNAVTGQSQEFAVRRSLDVGTTITLRTAGGEPVSLSQEILSPNYLADTVVPCLNAIAEIQYVIDKLRGRRFQPIRIKSIRQTSPISVSLDGASEAIQLVQDTIVPWKRRHAEAMAHLSEQEKQAEIESKRAEVL